MSILNQPELQLNTSLYDAGVKLTILPLPKIGEEVWSGPIPASLINKKGKISSGSNAQMKILTHWLNEYLLSKKLDDFESPKNVIQPIFPNLQYAGYINRHFVYVNYENKPCLIIGII